MKLNRWSVPDSPPTTPLLVPQPTVKGIGNYAVHELPRAAEEAMAALRERGWKTRSWWDGTRGRLTSCVTCRRHQERGFQGVGICDECIQVGRCVSSTGRHRPIRGWIIKRDGIATPRRFCGFCGTDCGDPEKRSWLYNIEFYDNRSEYVTEPCERCGTEEGTQVHHWAPRAIFVDASAWPTSSLCQPCHSAWHDAMRRSGGWSLPANDLACSPNMRDSEIWAPWLYQRQSAAPESS